MAVRDKDITTLQTFGDKCWVVAWTGLTHTTSDSGDPFEMPGAADRSLQVTGTFGSGGTLTFEGSNDGTNWATLTDPQGNGLTVQAAKIEAVLELTRYVRPRITAGDGTTSLTATMLVRRPL